MLTLEDLPEDVIVVIFSQLSFKERMNTRLVSRKLLNLLDNSTLTKNDIFVVKKDRNLNEHKINSRHINLRIEEIEYPLRHQQFWENHGPNVRSIEMFDVNLRSAELYSIISHCPCIQSLSLLSPPRLPQKTEQLKTIPIEDSTDVVMICMNLQNLQSLEMEIAGEVSGDDFHTFTKFAFKLQVLKMVCSLDLTDIAVRSIVCKPLKKIVIAPECVLQRNGDFFLGLGPQLTSLYLTGLSGSLDNWIPKLADKFPHLTELGINYSDHEFLEPSLLLSLENLKYLSLKGTNFGDDVLSAALKLQHLLGLEMSQCKKLSSGGIRDAFETATLLKLVDLRLCNVFAVTDREMALVVDRAPNLKRLYLQGCKNVTRASLNDISNRCRALECLSLKNLIFGDRFFVSRINNLVKLKYLCVPVFMWSNVMFCKLNLSELEILRLIGFGSMSQDSFKSLLANCPCLRHIYYQANENDLQLLQAVGEEMGKPFCLKPAPYCNTKFNFFGLYM